MVLLGVVVKKQLIVLAIVLVLFGCAYPKVEIEGATLEYDIKGTGELKVLFDAGALSGLAGWESVWKHLPENITAIRYSRRGEGGSSSCTDQMSVSDYVDDVESLLKELKVQTPIMYVSHSLGGHISREYAARYPGDVSAMLFVDPSNPRDVDIVRTVDPENGPAELEQIKAQDYLAGEGKWCFLDAIWDKSPSSGFAEIGDLPVTLIASVQVNENSQLIFDSAEARKLWGEYQSEWVNEFPRGKAVLTENSGHFIQDEEPELVLKEIELLMKALSEEL